MSRASELKRREEAVRAFRDEVKELYKEHFGTLTREQKRKRWTTPIGIGPRTFDDYFQGKTRDGMAPTKRWFIGIAKVFRTLSQNDASRFDRAQRRLLEVLPDAPVVWAITDEPDNLFLQELVTMGAWKKYTVAQVGHARMAAQYEDNSGDAILALKGALGLLAYCKAKAKLDWDDVGTLVFCCEVLSDHGRGDLSEDVFEVLDKCHRDVPSREVFWMCSLLALYPLRCRGLPASMKLAKACIAILKDLCRDVDGQNFPEGTLNLEFVRFMLVSLLSEIVRWGSTVQCLDAAMSTSLIRWGRERASLASAVQLALFALTFEELKDCPLLNSRRAMAQMFNSACYHREDLYQDHVTAFRETDQSRRSQALAATAEYLHCCCLKADDRAAAMTSVQPASETRMYPTYTQGWAWLQHEVEEFGFGHKPWLSAAQRAYTTARSFFLGLIAVNTLEKRFEKESVLLRNGDWKGLQREFGSYYNWQERVNLGSGMDISGGISLDEIAILHLLALGQLRSSVNPWIGVSARNYTSRAHGMHRYPTKEGAPEMPDASD